MTETAANVALTFDDVGLIRAALIEWASRPVAHSEAVTRVTDFAAFAIRHPELLTAMTKQGELR